MRVRGMVAPALIAALMIGTADSPALGHDPVPKTVEGGSRKVNRGGEKIGEGFRHMGRGIKNVFTGKRSKEEFKKSTKIGEGFKDVGLGVAGVGRGVGREVRDRVAGDDEYEQREYRHRDYREPEYDAPDYEAPEDRNGAYLEEEPLPE